MKSQNVVILGASGSIGQNTLSVVANLNKNPHHQYRFRIKALVSNSNWQVILKQIRQFKPSLTIMSDYTAYDILKRKLSGKNNTIVLYGENEIRKLVYSPDVDIVVSAISGAEGLYPTLWAIQSNKIVALANKESLVMSGGLLRRLPGFKKVIPIDSEHSGLFQIFNQCDRDIAQIKKVVLTASGGPFYNLAGEKLSRVTPASALEHPTYKMGSKITIDSATLMNKALEIIEAHYLFGVPADKIKVVIHPQSIVHAMVEFIDGSVIAQMNPPDMRLPIQYALTYPERAPSVVKPIDFSHIKKLSLTFIEPDTKRFPALLLGYEVIRRGKTTGAVLNATNEEAVKLFLNKKISFTEISKLVSYVLRKHKPLRLTMDNIKKADRWARLTVEQSHISLARRM
jgi:1-deoxy-D-xylulose-5-phosphate reductoisomerase